VKRYLDREETLQNNVIKIYRIVYGQCTAALKSTIKGDSEYKVKAACFNSLLLLNKVKIIMASVDTKANTALTLHEQILSFFNMQQGTIKTEDDYFTRFTAKATNLEFSGGKHIFCSPQLLKQEVHMAAPDEVEKEAEHFRAICFMLRADEA